MEGQLRNPVRWYALRTRSRHEQVVHDGLAKKGVSVFLPKTRTLSTRKDRRKFIEVPMFPGYVFVESDLEPHHHLLILKTVGAVELVGMGRRPVAIPKNAIDSLCILARRPEAVVSGPLIRKGDPVLIVSGPFVGVEGIFDQCRGNGRVIVNIEILGQSAAVDVDTNEVEIAGNTSGIQS